MRSLSLFTVLLMLLGFAGGLTAQTTPAQSLRVRGFVKSAGTPIPGAKVTATEPASANKITAWTDLDGSFTLQVPAAGHYSVTVEMPAFAPLTHDVAVDASGAQANFDLVLISRSQQTPAPDGRRLAGNGAGGGRGFQSLGVLQAQAGLDAAGSNDQVVPQGMPIPGVAA